MRRFKVRLTEILQIEIIKIFVSMIGLNKRQTPIFYPDSNIFDQNGVFLAKVLSNPNRPQTPKWRLVCYGFKSNVRRTNFEIVQGYHVCVGTNLNSSMPLYKMA